MKEILKNLTYEGRKIINKEEKRVHVKLDKAKMRVKITILRLIANNGLDGS